MNILRRLMRTPEIFALRLTTQANSLEIHGPIACLMSKLRYALTASPRTSDIDEHG
jgi:hypothetical protein